MEETGCEIIYGAPTTLAVKGQMMMMNDIQKLNLTSKLPTFGMTSHISDTLQFSALTKA